MPCAFHYKRPAPFDDLDPGCQFDEPDRRLIEYRGKQWCYFHLPKEAKIPERHENLPACINDHIERLISNPDKSEYIDLSGVNVRRAITINGDRDNIIRRILFASSTFYGGAVFNKVKFHENCIFSESEFCGPSSFAQSTFNCDANFDGVSFKKAANFAAAAFFHRATFNNSEILSSISFRNTLFMDESIFSRSTFSGYADFSWREGRNTANHPDTGRFGPPNSIEGIFHNSKFNGWHFDISNRIISQSSNFGAAEFRYAPDFHGCEFHQDVNFSGTRFIGIGNGDSEEAVHASMAYRTLKLAMENLRARDEEAQFFRLEQRSKRNRDDIPKSVKFASYVYELSADYGQSLLRPWICFAGLFLLFAMLNVLRFQIEAETGMPTWEALSETFQQTFWPFHGFDPRLADAAKPPVVFRLLGAVHSMANFGLLALFLVALRRRFKMI